MSQKITRNILGLGEIIYKKNMGFAFSSSWDKNWLVKLRAGFSRVKLEVFSSRTFQNIVSPNITRNIIGLGGIIYNKICHLPSVQTGDMNCSGET